MDVDAWDVDGIRVKGSGRHQLLDLSNGHLSCFCHIGVEVTGCATEDQVALSVSLGGGSQGQDSRQHPQMNHEAAARPWHIIHTFHALIKAKSARMASCST